MHSVNLWNALLLTLEIVEISWQIIIITIIMCGDWFYTLYLLTLQREVTSAAHHSENFTCRGVTSTARHAALSHSFDYISTT